MILPEHIAKVAKEWVGTPFFPYMAKKGVGADCVHLALAIYQEAGVVPAWESLPRYHLDGGEHLDKSIVIQWLESHPYMIWVESPEIGDLITLQYGRVIHHVGVMVGERMFVQCIRKYGVIESDLRDPTWSQRVQSVWRPKVLCHSDQPSS